MAKVKESLDLQIRAPVLALLCFAICFSTCISENFKECGSDNPNGNVIDLSEPESPGSFHDLTIAELRSLRTFLENDPNIRAVKPSEARVNSSYIHAADLWLPTKFEVLEYPSYGHGQAPRRARVMVFRGDLDPPKVIEYICEPLPNIKECTLLSFENRRNPVEFEIRPINDIETEAIMQTFVYTEVEDKLGFILRESYNATFTDCESDGICLTVIPVPVGSGLTGNINERRIWLSAAYDIPYKTVHHLDFALEFNTTGSDVSKWSLLKIWYAGRMFDSMDELIVRFNSVGWSGINKQWIDKPVLSDELFSTLHRRGEALPKNPQRPPTLVEPDGKRYSLQERKVNYMGWAFHFRMSAFTGPALYDITFKGEKIAYEIALNEIAVFYSGLTPDMQSMDLFASGMLLGTRSKSLVPGADCPETATLIHNNVMSQKGDGEPEVYKAAMCLFEQNNGYPLRRHLSYDIKSGGFYGGMMDSALTLRSILTIENYDYVVDYIFHQNGALETRFMNTGYIMASPYTYLSFDQSSYGYRLQKELMGNLHHVMVNFKADIDIRGQYSNHYVGLHINEKEVSLAMDPSKKYSQTKYHGATKPFEKDSLYKHNPEKPRYHLFHNDNYETRYDVISAYRLQINGMSRQLLAEGKGNEPTAAWSRHNLVVTDREEDEFASSSSYAMFDSLHPVVNFTTFYENNDFISYTDLVAWISMGLHQLPHTEDFPVTSTMGNQVSFLLMPYNFFRECPSMGSRDAIYVSHKDPNDPTQGVKVERYGSPTDQCVTTKPTFEEAVAANPNQVLKSDL